MRSLVLFCLVVSFAMFEPGFSLQCYSCPEGSSSSCQVTRDCSEEENTCLKLTSGEKTHTACLRYSDCDFMILAARYSLIDFTFSCCQSKLCNTEERSLLDRLKAFLG